MTSYAELAQVRRERMAAAREELHKIAVGLVASSPLPVSTHALEQLARAHALDEGVLRVQSRYSWHEGGIEALEDHGSFQTKLAFTPVGQELWGHADAVREATLASKRFMESGQVQTITSFLPMLAQRLVPMQWLDVGRFGESWRYEPREAPSLPSPLLKLLKLEPWHNGKTNEYDVSDHGASLRFVPVPSVRLWLASSYQLSGVSGLWIWVEAEGGSFHLSLADTDRSLPLQVSVVPA